MIDTKKIKYVNAYAVLTSVLALLGAHGYFLLRRGADVFQFSFVSLLLFVPIYLGVKYLFAHINKRTAVFSAVCGFIFATSMIIGAMLYKSDRISFSVGILFKTIFLSVFFFTVFGVIITFLSCYSKKESRKPSSLNIFEKLFTGGKAQFLLSSLFILACWTPVFLAFFPGLFNYDAIAQIDEVRKDVLSSHHPVLHTLFLYATIDAAGTGLWSSQTGMALHSLVQMLILSLSMGYACKRLAKWNAPRVLQIAAPLFFAFFPVNPLLAISATKDVIFTALFLVASCMTFDVATGRKKLSSPVFTATYILTIIGACLFRNTGAYILAVMLLILLFVKKCRKSALLVCGVSMAAVMIINGPVQNALGIEKGDSREALCVPIQQISRAYLKHPERFSAEDEALLKSLIPEEALSQYTPRNADFTKNSFNTDEFEKNTKGFIKLWLKAGVKSPKTYAESYLSGSFGYWYSDMTLPDELAVCHPYIELENKDWGDDFVKITPDSKMETLKESLKSLITDAKYKELPIVSTFFSPGFMFYILAFCTAALLYFKKYKALPVLLSGLLLWGTFTLSPVVLIRYAYPLFLCSFVYLAALFCSLKESPTDI